MVCRDRPNRRSISLITEVTMKPFVAHIFIYPIKSLDRVQVEEATILESGALKHDREWALFDERGKFVNGKNNAKVHLLRCVFSDRFQQLSLQIQNTDQKTTFNLHDEPSALEDWLENYFGFPVKLAQNQQSGFPDDTNANGPTVISTGTIEAVASWFPGISVEEMRLRLRANLEIGGVPPFWEDRLFAEAGQCVRFQIGDVEFEGINPCQRCVVPVRDPKTGEATDNFQKRFVKRRKETLPDWTVGDRFNHFFRLSVNTNLPPSEAGKVVRKGDEVKVLAVCESNLS